MSDEPDDDFDDDFELDDGECETCGGEGYILDEDGHEDDCPDCGGSGYAE